ncbi:MAG: DM13 domain-containing protein [Saprospiraceae bacterium]|nr:DM13 domain-containing protein [Saprospiraceae bacterium]
MKFNALVIALFSIVSIASFTACEKEVEVIVDPTKPQGVFTASKNGAFVAQNGTGSKGTAQLGTDEDGVQFLKFGSDFATSFATGTVTVYLSTSMTFTPDPGNGNPALRLIGPVSKSGENYFLLAPAAESKFTHVILWCGSANVPFGYAPLQ